LSRINYSCKAGVDSVTGRPECDELDIDINYRKLTVAAVVRRCLELPRNIIDHPQQ